MPNATRPIIQIVGLVSNNFSGKLSIKALANLKSLMADNEAQSKYLQSDVEQGNELYYQDVIIVTLKGLEIKLVKILTLFTSIDLLCNNLDGPIPNEIEFILTGLGFGVGAAVVVAPVTFWEKGRKWHDDSIDKILLVILPMMGLSYTSYYNAKAEAEEDIEDENTEDSEDDDDEMEDEEIWGRYCVICSKLDITTPKSKGTSSTTLIGFDWQFILTGLGFGVGAAVVVAPLTFWEKGRKWHDGCIDKILLVIFPMLGLSYNGCYNTKVEEDEDIGDSHTEDCEDNGDEDEMEATQKSEGTSSTTLIGFDWQFILTGLGFGVGAAVVLAPVTFWEKARKWQDDSIGKILLVILPMMGLSYTGCYNAKVEAEEDIEDENTDDSEDDDDDDEMEDEEFRGRPEELWTTEVFACEWILEKMMIRESEYGFPNWVRMITDKVVAYGF
ncbi:hypothetical protein SO802_031109 [Lithocarpus litseifolius]|uniref:Uncharacterized protein n=1 Tax=Lithocarpus litseifolius TaxID=425828 RepID=A0AAW2BL48_9ROSI